MRTWLPLLQAWTAAIPAAKRDAEGYQLFLARLCPAPAKPPQSAGQVEHQRTSSAAGRSTGFRGDEAAIVFTAVPSRLCAEGLSGSTVGKGQHCVAASGCSPTCIASAHACLHACSVLQAGAVPHLVHLRSLCYAAALFQPLTPTVIMLACCKQKVHHAEQLVQQPHLFGALPVQAVLQPHLICAAPTVQAMLQKTILEEAYQIIQDEPIVQKFGVTLDQFVWATCQRMSRAFTLPPRAGGEEICMHHQCPLLPGCKDTASRVWCTTAAQLAPKLASCCSASSPAPLN